jgi:O-antigen ligase
MIERRLGHTQKQVAAARTHGDLGARPALYRDTWEMAKAKILFGWGMNSYPIAFQQFNSTPAAETWARYWRGPIFYHDAHSDWLQTLAEHGVIGTALLLLIAIIPAIHARRELAGILPRYLLLGCGLVAAYSALEFPFGNLAVVLTWWILFFMAVSYARLSAK